MMAVPVARAYNYDEAKLLIDVFNAKDNKIVWRGITTDNLKQLKTPEERVSYIHKVMVSIFKTLPSKTVIQYGCTLVIILECPVLPSWKFWNSSYMAYKAFSLLCISLFFFS